MVKIEPEKSSFQKDFSIEKICNLSYISEMAGGKKQLMKEIIDIFLKQVPEELHGINTALTKADYATIKSFAHKMKSSVSIMGISTLSSVLKEMEYLATMEAGSDSHRDEKMEKINQ